MKSNKQLFNEIYGTYQDSSDFLIKDMLSHDISMNEYYKKTYKLVNDTLDKLTEFEQLLQLQYQLDAIEFEYYIKVFDKVSEKIESLETLKKNIVNCVKNCEE